jgi:ATP-dependent DNA helicase PIF1
MSLDLNPQFQQALELMETADHVFITGHAGTGKSTLLEHFRENTTQNVAVLAPTGVAALNVKGQTIHSFFGFRPNITPDIIQYQYKRRGKKGFYKKLDAIIIDEISMVRADLMDCIDEFLRMHGPNPSLPFGGIRMIMIGDLHQLPPVVTRQEQDLFKDYYSSPYFFSAQVFDELQLKFIELEKIYRQQDQSFINILSKIRNREITQQEIGQLNQRHQPDFEPDPDNFYIHLTTTNYRAQQINKHHLKMLETDEHMFEAELSGDFSTKVLPTELKLKLRVGAQVMLTNNDPEGRWVNGSLGQIIAIESKDGFEREVIKSLSYSKTGQSSGKSTVTDQEMIVRVRLDNGQEVEVESHTWEMYKFIYNPGTNKLQAEVVGTFKQYPMILAWAITIHKSQGKTFDQVVIDFNRGTFAHGQAYVALSRCRSLEGIVLLQPFVKSHIQIDSQVGEFMSKMSLAYGSGEGISAVQKIQVLQEAIDQSQVVKLSLNGKNTLVQPLSVGKNGLTAYVIASKEQLSFDLDEISKIQVLSDIS